MRVRRTVWRHVPAGAEPLHLGWMQGARGRWVFQRPRITCLYTAYREEGARAEYQKLAQEAAYARQPRDLVSLLVDVTPVLDIADPDHRDRYGIHLDQVRGDRPADIAACHRVVKQAVLRDHYRAIRAPSAAADGEVNLMIYPESGHGRLRLTDGPTRIPLNY